MRRNIEEHFERCIHALEVREAFLLDQFDSMIERHCTLFFSFPFPFCLFLALVFPSPLFLSLTYSPDEKIETIQNGLNNFIQDCNEILKTGALIYGKSANVAEQIWQVCSLFFVFSLPSFFPFPFLILFIFIGSLELGETTVFNHRCNQYRNKYA